jgi:phycocyanobilin:ferredoxin oxidoreductase
MRMLKHASTSLRESQHPLIHRLADCIENTWRQNLEISPYKIPEGLGFIEGALEGDRLVIENHCYQAPQFRKLHLELAQVGKLDILHCVMFPNPNYALPIFGADLVGGKSSINAAIADLSPISSDRVLPKRYRVELAALPEARFSQPRELPEWGDIFSEFCLFVRPASPAEEEAFLKRVQDSIALHCLIARQTTPVDSPQEALTVLTGQQYYCAKQRQNDKTRRVLEKSFGPEWTERYMSTMLFDCAA